jgi:SAM-dependent methyltransferase
VSPSSRVDEAAAPGILNPVADDLLWRHVCDLPAFRALLRAIEARFYAGLPLVEPVLDLGCGDGHFGALALPRPPQVGLDARAEGGRIPFSDGSFATVISNSVLEHIARVEPVLEEVARVLRRPAPAERGRAGVFLFSVPDSNFVRFLSIGRALDWLGQPRLGDAYRSLFNRMSGQVHCDGPEVWRSRLEAAGLHVVSWRPYVSRRALVAVEWGHYLGLPSLVARRLTGRWILWPSRLNLGLTEWLVRPLYREPPPQIGAYLFVIAERVDG